MVRVFVSSVMEGFEAEREAAREAIRSLGLEAVMAEDFGAQACSPQEACLAGVRSSDVYLGILGERYGYVTKSGVSVSQEEFNEARQQGKQTYVFVKNCKREAPQEHFFQRTQSYEEGCFLEFFDSPTQLAAQVTGALHQYSGGLKAVQLGSAEAADLAEQYAADIGPSMGTDTAVGAVLIPVQRGQYLPLSRLGKKEQQDEFLQPALFGPTQLLDPGMGTNRVEKENSFAFTQEESRGRLIADLEFHPDGSLVWLKTLPTANAIHRSLVRTHVIDEVHVNTLLKQFFSYAQQYYSGLSNSALLSQLYLTCLFYNMQMKWFGRIPSREPNGMSIPMAEIENPFLVPSEPLRVARAKLTRASELTEEVVSLVSRTFRVRDRYYPLEDQ